jgi:hypothetical protein
VHESFGSKDLIVLIEFTTVVAEVVQGYTTGTQSGAAAEVVQGYTTGTQSGAAAEVVQGYTTGMLL